MVLEQRHWAIRCAASKAAMPEKTPALISLPLERTSAPALLA
jgi:hypothetical protein